MVTPSRELPIQFWSKEILINLENHLVKFIAIDKVGLQLRDKIMVRVMVEFDITEGMSESLLISCVGRGVLF